MGACVCVCVNTSTSADKQHKPQALKHTLYVKCHVRMFTVPGSSSCIVMTVMLGELIATRPGRSVEVITTWMYSKSSVVLSSRVRNIKVKLCSPEKLTVYGPGV